MTRFFATYAAVGLAATVHGADAAAYAPAAINLLDMSAYPTAKCLDGSPGAFYFKAATASANATKWVFSLEGGGECVDEASCVGRSKTDLGSSLQYPATQGLGQFQDSNPAYNPDMFSYNFVFIKYCSGDLHSGMQASPNNATWNLQFSGHNIVSAVLQTLAKEQHLNNSELVVWSGDSAGGIGSVATVDFVLDSLPASVQVVGAPIGGFYFSNNWTYTGPNPKPAQFIPWTFDAVEQYAKLWSSFVPHRCAATNPDAPWQCMFAQASYPTLQSPLFVIEAQTDEVVMPLHNGLPAVWHDSPPQCDQTTEGCPSDIVSYMESWRSHMWDITKMVVENKNKADGLFHPACLIHCSFQHAAPLIDGLSYVEALGNWLFKRTNDNFHYDDCGVMCNPTCKKF